MWTEEQNKATINQYLDYYAEILKNFAAWVEQIATADLITKLKALQTLKSVVLMIDTFLRRWSFAYRGYDANTHKARQDAEAQGSERGEMPVEDDEESSDEPPQLKILLRELPEGEGTLFSGEPLPQGNASPDDPPPAPVKRLKKTVVFSKITKFLENGEQPLAKIAENIGRSERSVRRDLKEMIDDGKVSVVEKGIFRLHRSVVWTEADNRELINEALRVYIEMADLCKDGVKEGFTLEEVSDTEQIKILKTFHACAVTIDRLMKRWALVHLGWNTNPQLAKADAEKERAFADRVELENAPLEEMFSVERYYHVDMKEILFNMPGTDQMRERDPNYEVGLWSYDMTTKELYPPNSEQPISEENARKILLKRKNARPAWLAVFTSEE